MPKDRVEVFLIISLVLAVLGTFLIVSFWPTKCNANITVSEGFSTSDSQLTTCPFGSKPMYTSNGDLVCCKGRVDGAQCNGKLLCTFSSPTSTLKTCRALVDDYMNEKQVKFCPRDLPNYFENKAGYPAGCTNGRLLADRTAPVEDSAEKCEVYQSNLDDISPTSCKNRLPGQFKPVQGNKTSIVNVKQNYTMTFTINQYERVPFWSNVFHFTTTDTDAGTPGSRTPAVWFAPNSSRLHIIIGDMNDWNWGLHLTDELPMNQPNTIMVTCKDKSVVFVINGKQISFTQPSRRVEGQATLYTSDPWYPAAKVVVSNFSYRPLF